MNRTIIKKTLNYCENYPNREQRQEVSKCSGRNGTNRLAPGRVSDTSSTCRQWDICEVPYEEVCLYSQLYRIISELERSSVSPASTHQRQGRQECLSQDHVAEGWSVRKWTQASALPGPAPSIYGGHAGRVA